MPSEIYKKIDPAKLGRYGSAEKRVKKLNEKKLFPFEPNLRNRFMILELLNKQYFYNLDELMNSALFNYFMANNVYSKFKQPEIKPAQTSTTNNTNKLEPTNE